MSAQRKDDAMEQLLRAIPRVGLKAEERFAWLLRFAERDLRKVPAEATQWEVAAFIYGAQMAGSDGTETTPVSPVEVMALFDQEPTRLVQRVQRDLQRLLGALRAKRLIPFRITYVFYGSPDVLIPVLSGNVRKRFRDAVGMLLKDLGDKVGVCSAEPCNRVFFRTGRQEYCSVQCSQRVRSGRFRQAHPDQVREGRHETYKRKRQRTLGSKVKVMRRTKAMAPETPGNRHGHK
jgi:hypothetical protein